MILKTITDTTTGLTVSEHHGTGADTMTHGTGTPGAHGITAAGTALGTAGTTHGTTEDTGEYIIHGIRTMPDGTEDGIRIGDTAMARDMDTEAISQAGFHTVHAMRPR